MKLFKNQFFLISFLITSIFTSTLIISEYDALETTEPVQADQSAPKSWIERFKETNFFHKKSEHLHKPSFDASSSFEKPVPQPHRIPEHTTSNRLNDFLSFFSKKSQDPLSNYHPTDKSLTGNVSYEIDWNNLSKTSSKNFEQQRSSWTNFFKSDQTLLKNYLQDPQARAERMQEPKVKEALKQLSRTQTAELFTKITHDEIQEIKRTTTLSTDEIEKLYLDIFNKNEQEFKKLLEETDPFNKKEYILIPSRPAKVQANYLVNFKFEILDMTSYDSNLTIAENAERMKRSQDLSTQAQDRFAQAKGETSNANLVTYMKNYLEDHPTFKNLKSLMVNEFTALNRTTNIQTAQAELAKILNPKNDLLSDHTSMANLFRNLTADQLTEITKAQIKAQERNMNLAGKGVKISHQEAQKIFEQNAKVYERFLNKNTLLIPVESSARNNIPSLKFDKINLGKFQKELNEIDFKNVDLNIFDPASREFYAKKNIEATEKLRTLIQTIKNDQPEITLSDFELAKYIKRYY